MHEDFGVHDAEGCVQIIVIWNRLCNGILEWILIN